MKQHLVLIIILLIGSTFLWSCQDDETYLTNSEDDIVLHNISESSTSNYLSEKYKPVDIESLRQSLFFQKINQSDEFNIETSDSSNISISDSLDIERAVELVIEDTTYYTVPYFDYFDEYFQNLHIKEYAETIIATRIEYHEIDDSLTANGFIIDLDSNPITATINQIEPPSGDCYIDFFEYECDDCCICVQAYEVCDNLPPSGGGDISYPGDGDDYPYPGGGGSGPNPPNPTTTPITPVDPDDCQSGGVYDYNNNCNIEGYEECTGNGSQSDCWQYCDTYNCVLYGLEGDYERYQLVEQLGLTSTEGSWLFHPDNSDVYDSVIQLRNEFGDDDLTNSVLNLIVQTHVYEGDLALIDFQGLIQKIKDAIFDGITSAAVVMRKIYRILNQWAQNHPGVIDWINNDIDFIADGLVDDPLIHIDLEEENISWKDLLVIWFFELKDLPVQDFPEQTDWLDGPYPTISFTNGDVLIEGAPIVQSVTNLEGVSEARQEAIDNILSGTLDEVYNSWDFEESEYWEAITEGNAATFFLGSYDTSVTIVDLGDGEYVLNFKIVNKTGWESGTRLIPDENGDGVNESIIPDKRRGEGIHLGGTIVNVFEWSEIYP